MYPALNTLPGGAPTEQPRTTTTARVVPDEWRTAAFGARAARRTAEGPFAAFAAFVSRVAKRGTTGPGAA